MINQSKLYNDYIVKRWSRYRCINELGFWSIDLIEAYNHTLIRNWDRLCIC